MKKKANINAVTSENLTPLHYATLVNIDNCPDDHMPSNIISNPNSKNINYNKITDILVKAFMSNDTDASFNSVDICKNDIISYDENGYAVFKEDPYDRTSRDISYTQFDISQNILEDFKENIGLINNLLKYVSDLDEKVKEKVTKKIKDSKTIISTTRTEDILEDLVKSEIENLRKKFSLKKKNIDEIIDDPYGKFNNNDNDYQKEQQNIITKIYKDFGDKIYDFLKYVINLKYQDITENTNIIIEQIVKELDKKLDDLNVFSSDAKKQQLIDKIKRNINIHDEKEQIKSFIKISIETVEDTEILNYLKNISEIEKLIEKLTDKTLGTRDTIINNAMGLTPGYNIINLPPLPGNLAPLAEIERQKFRDLLNKNKNIIEYFIPILLALKISDLEKEKIIEWYFKNLYLCLRRVFESKKYKELYGADLVTSIYILFLFGQKISGYIEPQAIPGAIAIQDPYDVDQKIAKIIDILLLNSTESKENKILLTSLVYSINTDFNGLYNNNAGTNNDINIDFARLNLFQNKLIPSQKTAALYNAFVNTNKSFIIDNDNFLHDIYHYNVGARVPANDRLGVGLPDIFIYGDPGAPPIAVPFIPTSPALVRRANPNNIILHKQMNYRIDFTWNNFIDFYNEKNIDPNISNNLYGSSIIYGLVLSMLGLIDNPGIPILDNIKEKMNDFIIKFSARNLNSDSEFENYTQEFVINILQFLYNKVRQQDTSIKSVNFDSIKSNIVNINGWIIDTIINTEINTGIFPTLLKSQIVPIDPINYNTYRSKDPVNINLYTRTIYNNIKIKLETNKLKKFIGLLDTQAEFLLNRNIQLDPESFIDFNAAFDIYNTSFKNLINSIPNKPGSIFRARANAAAPINPASIFERLFTITGDYGAVLPGVLPGVLPVAPLNGINIGNANFNMSQSDFLSIQRFFNCIKDFRDIIRNTNGNVLSNGECYNPGNKNVNNFFNNNDENGDYSGINRIRNIYKNNIRIILSYLHFVFDQNIQLVAGLLQPNEIHKVIENINIPNNFINTDMPLNEPNFNVLMNNIIDPDLITKKEALLQMNFFNINFRNLRYSIRNNNPLDLLEGPVNRNLREDNENTSITNLIPQFRTNITDVPAGLLDLEQGLVLSLIKQLGKRINDLFNTQIPVADNFKYYEIIASAMKYHLKIFLATLNIFYYYQLFCAIPCSSLYEKLKEQIIEFNKSIDEIKPEDKMRPEYELQLPQDVEILIDRVSNIILDQKIIRSRSIAQVMCDNAYLFTNVLKKIFLSNSVTQQALSMYDTANCVYSSLDAYKKYNKTELVLGDNYKTVHFTKLDLDGINNDSNLTTLPEFEQAIDECNNLTLTLTEKVDDKIDKKKDKKIYIVSSNLFSNFTHELEIEQNFGLKNIRLDDYNVSSLYLGFIKLFNDMYKKINPNKINISGVIKKMLDVVYESNAPVAMQQNVLNLDFSRVVNSLDINIRFNNLNIVDYINRKLNVNLNKNLLLYKIMSSFNIKLLFDSIADAFKLINKLTIDKRYIYRNYEYLYIIIIGIFQSKLVLKGSNEKINNLTSIRSDDLNAQNNNAIEIDAILLQAEKDINVQVRTTNVGRLNALGMVIQTPIPESPYHDIFSIQSALLVLASDKDSTKINRFYNSNHNLTKFIAEKILEEIQKILQERAINIQINELMINKIIKKSFALSIDLKREFTRIISDQIFIDPDPANYQYQPMINDLGIPLPLDSLTKTVICFERLFNGFVNPEYYPNPLEFHQSLNLLPIINCIEDEKFNLLPKLDEFKKSNLNSGDYNNIVKNIIQKFIFDHIHDISSNPKLEDIDLSNFNFNLVLKQDDDINECKYELLDYFDINTEADKQNYIKSMIDKDLIELFVYKYLYNVKNRRSFKGKRYYEDSFKELNNLRYPNMYKHEIIRSSIYSLYEKLSIDYVNNLINVSIQENIKLAFTSIIDNEKLYDINLNNIIDIYLPSEDYTYNFSSYTQSLIDKVGLIDISYNLLDVSKNFLDYKLIEDEDYDIYDDGDFTSDVITINSIKKYYPIFYSYNYEEREQNKECLIINYGLIDTLIKSGANVYIKDQAGKTVIDYIIEGRMHYIIEDKCKYIKERLIEKNLQYLLEKIIKNEKLHNSIFDYKINKNILYTNTPIKFVNDYENVLLYKLKNMDEIKGNVPINIKNIFKTYLLLQNIYWYRLLNKTFSRDIEYLNFFEIKYDYFKIIENIPTFTSFDKIDISGLKLQEDSDWKKLINDVSFKIRTDSEKLIKKTSSKMNKSTTLLEKTDNTNTKERQYIKNKNKIKLLKKLDDSLNYPIKTTYVLLNPTNNVLQNESKITIDKSIEYFRKIYQGILQNSKAPIMYTYVWDNIINFDKKFFIHLNMCNIYDSALNIPIINFTNEKSYSSISLIKPEMKTLNQENLVNFKQKINLLKKYMEPISKFIDGRMYENILLSNPLRLFEARTINHILTTYLGSNLIMNIEKLLFYDFKKRLPEDEPDKRILAKIEIALVDLKKYVTTDLLEDGYLSYDFIKIMLNFKITEFDEPVELDMDKIFNKISSKIISKISLLENTEENSKLLENIKEIGIYYQALYKEVVTQLLNFSDSYYRFIKNQYAGILMINKSF